MKSSKKFRIIEKVIKILNVKQPNGKYKLISNIIVKQILRCDPNLYKRTIKLGVNQNWFTFVKFSQNIYYFQLTPNGIIDFKQFNLERYKMKTKPKKKAKTKAVVRKPYVHTIKSAPVRWRVLNALMETPMTPKEVFISLDLSAQASTWEIMKKLWNEKLLKYVVTDNTNTRRKYFVISKQGLKYVKKLEKTKE